MSASLPTFEPDAPIAEIASALRQEGGVILKNLVSEDLMDKVYAEIMENTSKAQQESGDSEIWPAGNKTVGGLAAVSPSYSENLLLNPKTLEVADAILQPVKYMSPFTPPRPKRTKRQREGDSDGYGGFANVLKNEAGCKQAINEPTDPTNGPNCHHYNLGASVMLELHAGGENQILHRENSIYQPYIGYIPEMREFIVSVNWAGSDFTADNGATRVVPGSHRWPEQRIAQEDEVAQAVMPKGSVVIWLSRVLHGAGVSTVSGGRTAFFMSYVVDWVRQEENQYITVPPEKAEGLSERAQQIIGYRCSAGLGWAKGRSQDNLLKEGNSSPL